MKITNNYEISLPLAVWLLNDEYDYVDNPRYISATTLLKSVRQIVLGRRIVDTDTEVDISDYIASRFGNSVHDNIERAWRRKGKSALKQLGYPERVYENIVVNPTDEQMALNPDIIPIWIEQRATKQINGWTVGGKFDKVIQGRLFDYKTTSVWGYLKESKDDNHKLQGSIYRWLNPHLITVPVINIQYIFTDWQRFMVKTNPDYPKIKIAEKSIPLLSIEDTEKWISDKLKLITENLEKPEEFLPHCTDAELWRSDPQYKYFADANKTDGRSTKNFDNKAEADQFMASKGGKGVVKTILGEPKACGYCAAYNICKQKDLYGV